MPLGRLLAVARTGSLAVSFLLLLGAASAGDNAQARGLGRPAVEVTAAARHDASAPLWLLQRPDFTLEREEEEENDHRVHRFRKLPPAALRATGAPDAVLQSEMPWIRMPAVGVTFDGVGQGFTGPGGTFSVASAPPDTSGDVGPNHYIQVVNSGFAIFNKSGTTLFGPAPTNTLWSGFGGLCQTTNAGDAIVLYDALADRWFMTQFAFNTSGGGPVAPFFQCVAVSQTGDPTGAWYRYAYQYADFPDYGKFGVWPDGYYATFNMFAAGTLAWAGGNNCVYDRAAMLSGAPATQQCINLGTNYGGLLPADLDGTRLPPAGSPGYIMGFDVTPNSHLQLWHFRVSWANPAATTLTMQPTIPVATINLACGNGGTCVPQAGTANRLDTLGDRLMFRLAYRNFGTHDALVSNLTVNTAASSTANTGVRWFELRNPGTAPTLFQEGTYAPDANYRWMGSIAQDGQGNMGLGFSLSSSSLSPSIRYTGRLVTDPLGQMAQGENTIINGASQTGTLTRWGDYSMMGVDPTDDCTFWYTTEYLAAAGSFNWRT
ncbi:MAG TPA: hypothetical protein VK447_13095, partial [Myxococcaceae bacterium]|nr:hypothetical protein [Myxococcaceae bacterium]